ncbi:MAG: thioesterase [Spirochaetes bacterium]|nr:thioesterase [Spirochaetota bacterium]
MLCDIANPKGEGIVDVWQEIHPIRFGEIDKSDRLTLSAVLQSFQEAAICHAENLGVGREDMARTGRVWILSRMSVLAERRPKYCETVTIRSWPRGGEKLFAMRDYDIRDKENIPVVSARSAWLIVDIEKRRPLRPQSIMDTLPQNEGLDVFAPDAGGAAAIAERSNLNLVADTHAAERKALYTDIDYNGHVNNVSYIRWIEDALDPKLLEKADKMRLDINYLNEVTGGEVTEIYSAQIDDENGTSTGAFAFEGRKKESGQAAFRAELRLWS